MSGVKIRQRLRQPVEGVITCFALKNLRLITEPFGCHQLKVLLDEAMSMTEAFQVWPESGCMPTTEINLTQCSDLELSKRVARGDLQAFEEVYRRHNRLVYYLCLRMTSNVAEAEDLTQEVFVQLFRKIGSFRGEAALTTWLYRFTTNQVLMHFRKVKGRRERATEDGLAPERSVEGGKAAGQSPVLDQIALNKAVAQLPPGYRVVFILHDVIGYEHEEIGRLLGLATGTSKSQLHKARMRLRKLLGASSASNR